MKKLLVTLTLMVISVLGHAQLIPKPQLLKDFSTWSVSPIFALSYGNMDMEENDPFYKRTRLNTGFGLEVSKQLSHFASFQISGFNSKLKTEWTDYRVSTDFTQFDVKFRFNMTNGALFRKWQSTQIYAFMGYGVMWFDAIRQDKVTGQDVYQINDVTRVLPFGVGYKNRLGNRTSISADLSYNHTNSDKVDTWANGLTSKDGYTRLTVSLTYNLGKKRILEWDHPWPYLVPESVHDTTTVIQRFEYTPPPAPEPVKLDSTIIYYVAKHYQVEQFYIKDLDHVLERARDEDFSVEIYAYCDSSGIHKDNLKLVELRAKKVFEYAKRYVSEDRITIHKFDESAAVYAPEARNRKVVVKLVK